MGSLDAEEDSFGSESGRLENGQNLRFAFDSNIGLGINNDNNLDAFHFNNGTNNNFSFSSNPPPLAGNNTMNMTMAAGFDSTPQQQLQHDPQYLHGLQQHQQRQQQLRYQQQQASKARTKKSTTKSSSSSSKKKAPKSNNNKPQATPVPAPRQQQGSILKEIQNQQVQRGRQFGHHNNNNSMTRRTDKLQNAKKAAATAADDDTTTTSPTTTVTASPTASDSDNNDDSAISRFDIKGKTITYKLLGKTYTISNNKADLLKMLGQALDHAEKVNDINQKVNARNGALKKSLAEYKEVLGTLQKQTGKTVRNAQVCDKIYDKVKQILFRLDKFVQDEDDEEEATKKCYVLLHSAEECKQLGKEHKVTWCNTYSPIVTAKYNKARSYKQGRVKESTCWWYRKHKTMPNLDIIKKCVDRTIDMNDPEELKHYEWYVTDVLRK